MLELIDVDPVDPVAPWLGGKSQLSKVLCPLIDRVPHVTYAEPFVGMGGIFFRRAKKPKAEVINDFLRDVTNLFRILNRHFPQFCDVLKWQVTSREEFERLKNENPNSLTDLERAARFLYLQKTCFGGKVDGQNFGVAPTSPARFDLTKLVPILESVHSRLSGVVIENLDYKDFIPRYDRPETLFYLDPPYYLSESDYGRDVFSRDEFPQMSQILRGISGKFILSINDHPDIRQCFSGLFFEEVDVRYTISGAATAKDHGELIISNFNLSQHRSRDLFSC